MQKVPLWLDLSHLCAAPTTLTLLLLVSELTVCAVKPVMVKLEVFLLKTRSEKRCRLYKKDE